MAAATWTEKNLQADFSRDDLFRRIREGDPAAARTFASRYRAALRALVAKKIDRAVAAGTQSVIDMLLDEVRRGRIRSAKSLHARSFVLIAGLRPAPRKAVRKPAAKKSPGKAAKKAIKKTVARPARPAPPPGGYGAGGSTAARKSPGKTTPKKSVGVKKSIDAARRPAKKAAAKTAARSAPTKGGVKKAIRKAPAKKAVAKKAIRKTARPGRGSPGRAGAMPETTKANGVLYPVWFGTNRKPSGTSPLAFGNQRSRDLSLGRVDVWIPEAHKIGETSSSLWQKLKRMDFSDDTLRCKSLVQLDQALFWLQVRGAIDKARADGDPAQALVFVHGFNTNFNDAAIRAAQIGFDLGVSGATAFFSWPSRGATAGYAADAASIEASEQHIKNFLVDFARNCGADTVHLIAHSMGNRGVLRALQRIAADSSAASDVKFGQIFLAAPDVDRDTFLELAHVYRAPRSVRTTLYASKADLAVHLSKVLHDSPRAGYFEPYTICEGMDTIAVPDFDIDFLGHSFFAQAPALLHDIYDLMRNNTPPRTRQHLRERDDNGQSFWEIRK